MESDNQYLNSGNSRFNVVIRLRPVLGDESDEFTTEDDLYQCVDKMVII